MRLTDKVAIVTGASSGIGHAIALTFAKEGADVVIADVDFQSAQNVADELELLGRHAEAVKVDVSNSQEVNQLVKKTLDTFKKIDILVNNAGIFTKMTPPEEISEADWDRTINVNLKGQFLCSQAVGRQMIRQKSGKIVNIASGSAHRITPKMVAYCVSKSGVLSLTKALAMDWAKYNINVNSVSPGLTITPIIEKSQQDPKEFIERRSKTTPLKRVNKPQDIANAVLFLASSESDNMTGEDIIVDGGTCALHPGFVWALEE